MKQPSLQQLKDLLMTAENLAEPWEYFFDHFGESREFHALGKKAGKAPILRAMLDRVGHELFRDDGKVGKLRLVSIPQEKFVHGSCNLGGRMSTLFYFTDIKMGTVTVWDPTTGMQYHSRITATVLSGEDAAKEPILAPIPPTRDVVN